MHLWFNVFLLVTLVYLTISTRTLNRAKCAKRLDYNHREFRRYPKLNLTRLPFSACLFATQICFCNTSVPIKLQMNQVQEPTVRCLFVAFQKKVSFRANLGDAYVRLIIFRANNNCVQLTTRVYYEYDTMAYFHA